MKTYVGIKDETKVGHQIVRKIFRNDLSWHIEMLDPKQSQELWNHSPDGFQWGYGGSGPAQLALAILLDITGNKELSMRLHQEFKRKVIAALSDKFVLSEDEVLDFIQSQQMETLIFRQTGRNHR